MDFLFRIAILALGYFYPAYKCFKLIECGKPKAEQLHLWCQYWVIIAVFTGCERVADTFISWLPFYSGVKLAFVVYLWHPDTKGTEYVYQTFLKPLVSKHTESVDLNLGLLRDETVKVLIIFWTRLMLLVQTKVSGVLHQSAVESPNAASRPVQDGVPAYPSIPSLYWSNMQQQRPPFYQQPIVTRSATWPVVEEHKQQQHNSLRSIPLPPGQHKRPTQPLNHHKLVLQPGPKMQYSGAINTGADKDESDFELIHSNEVPIPGASEATALRKRKISAQGVRSRWWW